MGKRRTKPRSLTTPSSPSPSFSSSSSSSFEFTVSATVPRSPSTLCPADELFYKGQLLPLHLSPRISLVRTLLASASTSSSSDTATTASRDSSASISSFTTCDSSRPSSAADDDLLKPIKKPNSAPTKYFSLSKLSSVFRSKTRDPDPAPTKRPTSTAKEVIFKYLKKVKPLYEKLSQKQQKMAMVDKSVAKNKRDSFSHSFSGNLRYPKRASCISSCPSSMRSSPTHPNMFGRKTVYISDMSSSSMDELHGAIQGAIAHCKNSMIR